MSSYVLLGSGCQQRNQLLGNDAFPVKMLLYPLTELYMCVFVSWTFFY